MSAQRPAGCAKLTCCCSNTWTGCAGWPVGMNFLKKLKRRVARSLMLKPSSPQHRPGGPVDSLQDCLSTKKHQSLATANMTLFAVGKPSVLSAPGKLEESKRALRGRQEGCNRPPLILATPRLLKTSTSSIRTAKVQSTSSHQRHIATRCRGVYRHGLLGTKAV